MPGGVQLGSAYGEIRIDSQGVTAGVNEANTALGNIGRQAAVTGGILSAGISIPLIAIGRDAVNTAGDFEAQMNILQVAARSSGTSLEELQQAAMLVGADTQLVGINSAEAADAMTNLYKAGMDTSDIFGGDLATYLQDGTNLTGALRASIDLAAASELDLDQASQLVAISMATFGMSAEDSALIANSFVGSADASTTSVDQLAAAMVNLGPTAAQFGWDLDTTNTALALLSMRGTMGSEAGTALKSMMTNLMRPTEDVTGTLDALNVELYDANGNMLPLPNIIGQLESGMAGMSEEQRNATIQTLAGTYGMKAMSILLAEGTDGWNAMEGSISSAASAQEVGTARTQGWNAAWEQFQGTIETIYINVLTPLLQNVLTPLLQKITELAGQVLTLNPAVVNAALAFMAVLAAAGPVLLAITGIGAVIGALMSPIGLVVVALGLFAAAWSANIGNIRGTISTLVASVIELAGFFGHLIVDGESLNDYFVSTPMPIQDMARSIGVVISVIQELVQFFMHVITQGELLLDFFYDTPEPIQKMALAVANMGWDIYDWLMVAIPAAIDGLEAAWSTCQGAVTSAVAAISAVVKMVLATVQTFITTHGATVQSTLTTAWNTIQGVVAAAVGAIGAVVRLVFGVIQSFLSSSGASTESVLTGVWTRIQSAISTAVTAINTIVIPIFNGISAFISAHAMQISALLQAAWNTISAVITARSAVIQAMVETVLGAVGGFIATHGDEIRATFDAAWNAIAATINSVLAFIMATVIPLLTGVAAFIRAHGADIQAAIGMAWSVISTVITEVTATIQTIVETVLGAISAFVTAHGSEIRTSLDQAWAAIWAAISAATAAINAIISVAFSIIRNILTTHGTDIQAVLTQAWTAIQSAITLAVELINLVVIPVFNAIAAFVTAHSAEIQSVLTSAWIVIRTVIQMVIGIIQGIINAALALIKGDWSGAWEAIQGIVDVVWNAIQTLIDTVLANIFMLIDSALSNVDSRWRDVWDAIKLYVSTVWMAISSYITSTITAIKLVIGAVLAVIQGDWGTAWENIQTAAQTIWDAIVLLIDTAFTAITTFLDNILLTIESLDIGPAAKLAFDTFITGMNEKITAALLAITTFLSDVWTKISTKKYTEATKTSFQTMISGLATKVTEALTAVTNFLSDIATKIGEATFESDTMTAIATVVTGIINKVVDVLTEIGTMLDSVKTKITEFSLLDAGEALISGMIDGVKAKAQSLIDAVGGAIGAAIAWGQRLLNMGSPSKVFAEMGRMAMLGFVVGVDEEKVEVAKKVANAIAAVIDAAAKAADTLRAFQPVEGMGVITAQLMDFLVGVETQFSALVAKIDADLATKAAELAKAVGEVMRIVGGAVDAFTALTGADLTAGNGQVERAIVQINQFITRYTNSLAWWAGQLRGEALAKAQEFAEAAKPVMDVVAGAVDSFMALAGVDLKAGAGQVDKAIVQINQFITRYTNSLGWWAGQLRGEALEKAQAFAEAAGPIVDLVGPAVDAFLALAGLDLKAAGGRMEQAIIQINQFITRYTNSLAWWAGELRGEALAKAREFAEAAGPVVEIVGRAVDAFTALSGLDLTAGGGRIESAIVQINQFIARYVKSLAYWADTVSSDALEKAQSFAEDAANITGLISDAVSAMQNISQIDLANLETTAYEIGLSWVTALADGILAGIDEVGGALGAALGLLIAPDQTGQLSPVQAGGEQGGRGQQAGGMPVVVNITGDWNIRDDTDIQRVAEAVGEVFAREGQTANRMNVGWSGA